MRTKGGLEVTYTLVPGVPEFTESLVKTDGESEGAGKDASDEDACQGKREFPGIRAKWSLAASYCSVGRWCYRKRW